MIMVVNELALAGRPSNWNTQDIIGSKSVRVPSVLDDALLTAKDNHTDVR